MQIKAAVRLLRHMDGLPMPRIEVPQSSDGKTVPDEMDRPMVHDLLDWLWQTFGFQVPLNEYPMDFHFLYFLALSNSNCALLIWKFQTFYIFKMSRMKLQT